MLCAGPGCVPGRSVCASVSCLRAHMCLLMPQLPGSLNTPHTTRRHTPFRPQANPFACVASGIAALWGPAHGGANEAVLKMLEEILAKGGVDAIPEVREEG